MTDDGREKPNGKDRLLTQKQAAAILQCSPSTVGLWIKLRRIKFVRLPSGTPRLKESVVRKYLEDVAD